MSTIAFHPFAALFPMLPDEQLQELANDIGKNGLRSPVVVDSDNKVLDGRHRIAACRIAGVEPEFETFTGDDAAKLAFVVSVNLHRRHLTPSQASMCAARARELYEQQAKDRHEQKSGRPSKDKPVENLPPVSPSKARDAAGKAFGVSGKSVDYAKKVIDKGIPELAKAVDEGRMSVSHAAVIATEPPEVQKEAIDKRVRSYARKAEAKPAKTEERKPRHAGEHNLSQVFAMTTAQVAITQLKSIPRKNQFLEDAFSIVIDWITAQRKELSCQRN